MRLSYIVCLDGLKYAKYEAKQMYIDLAGADHSKAQLAKVHACIREIAKESGYTFDEVKCLTPGIAHSFVSNLFIETNCKIGFFVSEFFTIAPFSSRFHLYLFIEI